MQKCCAPLSRTLDDSGDGEDRGGMDGLRVSEGFFLFLSDRLSENSSELSTIKKADCDAGDGEPVQT